MTANIVELPEWSPVVVTLLGGVVYGSDARAWGTLISHRSAIDDYIGKIGLRLVIDETDPGVAYVRSLTEDEISPHGATPKQLLRKTPLSYGHTVLCVLLRDEYRRFDDRITQNERCVVDEIELFEQWRSFFPQQTGEKKLRDSLRSSLKKLAEIGLTKSLGREPPCWEVMPVLKRRLTVDVLETLRRQLVEHPGGKPRPTADTNVDSIAPHDMSSEETINE